MYEQVAKAHEKKSQMETNGVSQMQNNHAPTSRFVDKRPEAIQMRKLRDLAKNSPKNAKLRELHHLATAHSVAQKKSNGKQGFVFVDNRPEAIAQRKLQEMANNSPQVSQLRAFQNMANNCPVTKQAVQLQAMADNYPTRQQQPIQKKASPEPSRRENNTGLPDNLKNGIENLSGYSMDDVKVHNNSNKPAQLQAHAYAQGTDIHLGAGQEKHLPHEAWYVVKQKEGRVKPTMQMKGGLSVNDDHGLEKEADMMGKQSVSYGFKSNIPTNQKPKQDLMSPTIQRFYAVQNEENVRENPDQEKGRINHLNLDYIWIPDPRNEDDYKYEVENTGWLVRNLYSREQINSNLQEFGGESTFEENTGSFPANYQTLSNRYKPNSNTQFDNYMHFARMAPVPSFLADPQSRKARATMERYTPKEPIKEGLQSMVSNRLEAVSETPQDPRHLKETLLWGDYFLNGGGSNDLADAIDIASNKLSQNEKDAFLESLENMKIANQIKIAVSLSAGLMVGQGLSMIPHPVAKASGMVWKASGAIAFYNKLGKTGQTIETLKTSHPKVYQVVEAHRNQKLGSLMEDRSKRVDEHIERMSESDPFSG